MAGLSRIDLQDVSKSLSGLSDVIKFITTGKADDLQDGTAWDERTNGGLHVVRLRAMLSPAQLELTAAYGGTLAMLQNIWSLVKMLNYGQRQDGSDKFNGDEYRGPAWSNYARN